MTSKNETRSRPTPGIRTRHSRACKSRDGGTCNCSPTYEAWVYSKRDDKKIRKSFPTLTAARGWRTDAAKQVKDKKLRAPSPRTLRQEVDEWIAGVRAGRIHNKRRRPYKPAVIRNYEAALRLRVLPELGDRKLANVDLADLIELQVQLQCEGCSASTIRNTFVPLQAVYRDARRKGVIAVNPTVDLSLPTAVSRDRAAAPAEAVELLSPLGELERALWATAFYAGLRRGEMRALRLRDVDLNEDAGTITVERGWDTIEGPIEPKSVAGFRTVFLADALRPYLKPLVERLEGNPDALLFGSGTETPFATKNVARKAAAAWQAENARRTEEAAEKEIEPALLNPITLHEARHSFSTFMDHASISESRADRYMGHSSGTVAGRYRHLLPGQLAEDRKRLDAYLAGVSAGPQPTSPTTRKNDDDARSATNPSTRRSRSPTSPPEPTYPPRPSKR
jgi:integrase